MLQMRKEIGLKPIHLDQVYFLAEPATAAPIRNKYLLLVPDGGPAWPDRPMLADVHCLTMPYNLDYAGRGPIANVHVCWHLADSYIEASSWPFSLSHLQDMP